MRRLWVLLVIIPLAAAADAPNTEVMDAITKLNSSLALINARLVIAQTAPAPAPAPAPVTDWQPLILALTGVVTALGGAITYYVRAQSVTTQAMAAHQVRQSTIQNVQKAADVAAGLAHKWKLAHPGATAEADAIKLGEGYLLRTVGPELAQLRKTVPDRREMVEARMGILASQVRSVNVSTGNTTC